MQFAQKKIILFSLLSIVLVAGVVITILRWNAWFGNHTEQPYEVADFPHNIVLTCGEKATSERCISWRCDTVLRDAYLILYKSDSTIQTYPATGEIIATQAGKAAYYQSCLSNLSTGTYTYQCIVDNDSSSLYSFTIQDKAQESFLLFGDVQDRTGSSATMFEQALTSHPDAQAMAFVGDMIERPLDEYWQLWFASMNNHQAQLPIIACTGNHDYHKGLIKRLDKRWTRVFRNPANGPYRFTGRTYFLDTQFARIIVLDTDALHTLSDYTITSTWLSKVLKENPKTWSIVIMHHPVYAARKGRMNPTIYAAFHRALKDADLVFCGHDHNYMRTGEKPVYILTSSADKVYPMKENVTADVVLSGEKVYEYITLNAQQLSVETYKVKDNTLFDSVQLVKQLFQHSQGFRRLKVCNMQFVIAAEFLQETLSFFSAEQ